MNPLKLISNPLKHGAEFAALPPLDISGADKRLQFEEFSGGHGRTEEAVAYLHSVPEGYLDTGEDDGQKSAA